VYCSDYLGSVDLFHIATMFSYPKIVWRIRLTRDLSLRVSLLDTIVGVWVWLLCSNFSNVETVVFNLHYYDSKESKLFSVVIKIIMAPQPGIIEAFLAQLGNMTTTVETAVLPSYGTDREVYIYIYIFIYILNEYEETVFIVEQLTEIWMLIGILMTDFMGNNGDSSEFGTKLYLTLL
jgi:hypothetical protein